MCMCDSWTPTKPYAGAKWPSAYPPTHTHPHTLAHTTQARSYVASLSQAHLRDKILHHQVCVRARACARACCVLCARRGRTSVFNCLSHTAPIGLINNDPPFCPPLTTTDPSACPPLGLRAHVRRLRPSSGGPQRHTPQGCRGSHSAGTVHAPSRVRGRHQRWQVKSDGLGRGRGLDGKS